MKAHFGRRRFYLSLLGALAVMLLASASTHAQSTLYQLDWGNLFNNCATDTDTEDNWVANSYAVNSAGTHIVSISLPLAGSYPAREGFTNQTISALIYKGADLNDPTAGGGLVLLSQTDMKITSKFGDIVTLTLDNPVDLNPGDIFYAAVLMPGVPPDKYPFYIDVAGGGLNLGTNPLGRSFFDVGLTFGGPYDVNQLPANSANITVLGGTHPVLGSGIQSPGNLALWVNATAQ
jgi:hypothetical protein